MSNVRVYFHVICVRYPIAMGLLWSFETINVALQYFDFFSIYDEVFTMKAFLLQCYFMGTIRLLRKKRQCQWVKICCCQIKEGFVLVLLAEIQKFYIKGKSVGEAEKPLAPCWHLVIEQVYLFCLSPVGFLAIAPFCCICSNYAQRWSVRVVAWLKPVL